MLQDLWVALGLMLVIEGILYALAPDAMRRMIAAVLAQPEMTIRIAGVATAAAGLIVVMAARG